MLLWILCAGLTAAVLAVVLGPVFTQHVGQPATAADLSAYTDHLADLDRQRAQGRLDLEEYDALRHEVSRRILRLDPSAAVALADTAPPAWPLAAAAIVPIACLALYARLGSPDVPARPARSQSVSLATASASEIIASIEARLAANPDDARGWDLVAPIYVKLQRFGDAAEAYQRAMVLLGETPQRLAGFAEATVMARDGIVTDAARAAYEKLAVLTPERFEPRFWLALAKEQDGNRAGAAADYRAMLAKAPADVSWRALVEQHLAAVTTSQPRGPTTADVTAAAGRPAADRASMIAGMVDGLAARLKTNSRDVEGWQRLIASYAALKQPDKARAALADARVALAGDTAAVTSLDQLARQLGVTP